MTSNTADPTVLNAERRRIALDELADGGEVDVLVIGGGITGAGVALDAASRGLDTVLVESHDLAFGTSRFSSKLVHGGLRYLSSGQVGIAYESARERGILMTRTAPHLVHPMKQVVPLNPSIGWAQTALIRTGFFAGDMLRRSARTPASVLPRSRRIDAETVAHLIPAVSVSGLTGGLMAHDGQLVDDARLVVAVARTAAQYGARIINHVRADQVTGSAAVLTDTVTGESLTVAAKAVINATGVWAPNVDRSIRLRPSRGTHLVFDSEAFGHPTGALTVPVPGSISRFVFALPQPGGRVYLGLTDEDAPGPIPDVPEPDESEVDFLLTTINTALHTHVTPAEIRGTFAGLRPLLESDGKTSDVSRKHAVLSSEEGIITIIGGKLTTYRQMAQDTVDKAVAERGLPSTRCRTVDLPLIGAPGHAASRSTAGVPEIIIERHGGLAQDVVDLATVESGIEPIAEGIDVTCAEIEYAITHEGALDVSDILDRRTRIGLVPDDAQRARPAVEEIFARTVTDR